MKCVVMINGKPVYCPTVAHAQYLMKMNGRTGQMFAVYRANEDKTIGAFYRTYMVA